MINKLKPYNLITAYFLNFKTYTILTSDSTYYKFNTTKFTKYPNDDNRIWSKEENFKYVYDPLKIEI